MYKWIHTKNKQEPDINWNYSVSIRDFYPSTWNVPKGMTEEDALDILEREGYSWYPTLKDACEELYEISGGDMDEAFEILQNMHENDLESCPLSSFGDYEDQYEVYEEYVKEFHPSSNVNT